MDEQSGNHVACMARVIAPPTTVSQAPEREFNIYRFVASAPAYQVLLSDYASRGQILIYEVAQDECLARSQMSVNFRASAEIGADDRLERVFDLPFIVGRSYLLAVHTADGLTDRPYSLTVNPLDTTAGASSGNHTACAAQLIEPPTTVSQAPEREFNIYRFVASAPAYRVLLSDYASSGQVLIYEVTTDECDAQSRMSVNFRASAEIGADGRFDEVLDLTFVPGVTYLLAVHTTDSQSAQPYVLALEPALPEEPSPTPEVRATATRTPRQTGTPTVAPTATNTLTPTPTATPPVLPDTTNASSGAAGPGGSPPTATIPPLPIAPSPTSPVAAPTIRPTPTATQPPPTTAVPTTPATVTPQPTATPQPTSTPQLTEAPSPTATPRATDTAQPTNTPLPSPTPTLLPPTATNTSVPTATRTPLPPTATNTPLPPTATNTPVPTATKTPLPPTATNTPLPTATKTPLPPTATNTPVPPPTATNTAAVANSYTLLTDDGTAMFLDYGFPSPSHFSANFRFAEHSLAELRRVAGLARVEVVLPSHYHDDHVCGLQYLYERHGAQLWVFENQADILEHTEAYKIPCLW
ncbi:MAG: MBL fold metallo-hydrolase, partial [Anaerolineae bacterium]|nr:MBL fold metallo-hydrolase [Anaerolineae bacterium]